MLSIKEMQRKLAASLPPKRYKHSLGVYETALRLAKRYDVPTEPVAVAALLHDCGREVPTGELLTRAEALGLPIDEVEHCQPILLHAKLGVYYAKQKYGVDDPAILKAIELHSTGAPDMTPLDMIIYLADLVEPGRDFAEVGEMRALVKVDLEQAMMKAYAQTITYLLERELLIHPLCVQAYNQLAAKFRDRTRSFKESKQ